MKKLLLISMIFVIVGLQAAPLPHNLTQEERDFITNNRQAYLQGKLGFRSRAPEGIATAPAEFEPAEGVIFAWEGYSSLIKQLVKFVAEDQKCFVAVDSSYYSSSAQSTLQSYGVNMENVEFLDVPLDSVWMRDYGPWWIYTQDGDREIIDLVYNRPRPRDDKFPENLAKAKNLTNHKCPFILPGGNLILDGHGVAIMTDVVFDPSEGGDPDLTVAEVEKYMKDYFGCTKVIFVKRMNNDGTGHVDMFCKLLNDNTFIVGKYASPEECAPGNYDILNENAEKLASETNGKGEQFNVVRIHMPDATSGGYWGYTSYSYTNSLIANNKVLVPVYGFDTDEEALNVYRQVLPDHDVKGFDSSGIISANGAIHCITKLMMQDPLEIKHEKPERGEAGKELSIEFAVESTRTLVPETVKVYWKTEGENFQTVAAAKTENGFKAVIPAQDQGKTVTYYLEAENSDSLYETLPENAPEEAFNLEIK